jgi:uncharacterized protein (TIGR02466 family)
MGTEAIFPTPIYWATVDNPQIQQRFEKVYENLILDNKLHYKSNWADTHKISSMDFSDNLIEKADLFEFKNELMAHLSKYLEDVGRNSGVEQVKITASWMSLFSRGDYAHQHCHGAADISGVYYVKAIPDDAKFYFRSSNKGMSSSYAFNQILDKKIIEPTTGMLVLFPGWLEHGVETQLLDHERVSVSFNLEFIRQL